MVALLSREECIFPYSYFEAVLREEGRQPWTFFELNGCPRQLLVPMMQLANLAAENAPRHLPSKRITRLVAEIETSIRKYVCPGGPLTDMVFRDDDAIEEEEEDFHLARDRYHCCEAFRYSLLIYILRIFTLRQVHDDRSRRRVRAQLSLLSRVTLDHISSCRPTSLIQKQLLFPVFMAGAETRTQSGRDIVRDYCERWYRKFGYQMYSTVLDTVQEVWMEQDIGNESFWWADVLDARRRREGEHVQFCFG